ncbi:glycoside hydrolase family 2 TIM barrel-domain containing protein [Allorhizocola rhizosphaerae]|uniref:glycoside hydrolase family 2 TIM barrel-domain containing protein n=1 Tax=Allorhizocola rhizosphaerae TaxID=1872709 RepID=UPI001B8C1703|nr:glycoside hydrolase family 2 TIM barrel-domain containing protein [Allorhizocola rhizosphaerae]
MKALSLGETPHETPQSLAVPVGGLPPRAHLNSDAPRLDLSGPWRFRLLSTADGPIDFAQPAYDDSAWEERAIPSHFGTPAYTNVRYPFPVEPPHIPDENPTADHRLTFDLPPDWPLGEQAALRFEGVDSSARVWINGVELGVTFGSRLPHEFAVGHLLQSTSNVLAVRVQQWSAGSYLEDQDMWWWPGIFREVVLISRDPGDVRVRAGYDHVARRGTLEVEGGEVVDAPDLSAVLPWTAETPHLYDVVVRRGRERVTIRVGFRTVSIEDGVLKVNGRRILFRGVNRHEFDPDHGRVMTEETMRADLDLMKRHNVNAIRTSHYPPHPRFLELCDEYGFWVIDECDFETHGFEYFGWKGNPTDDPRWREALVDRATRMVARDHNRPSVIMWSLGNEAGVGQNLAHMAAAIRALDPTRPIHYEGDRSYAHSDVHSRMYAPHAEVEEIGKAPDGKPFILCEYAHAMGNGPGGLSEYQRLFETYERCQGGFVWEWIDHGIRKGDHFAYGGDFGEEYHDGNFVCDGLVFPDRTPSPGLLEFKKVIEPVRITADGIENLYDFASLEGLTLRCVFEVDGVPVHNETRPCPPLLPGERAPLDLPAMTQPGWWTVSVGDIAWGQWEVGHTQPLEPAKAPLPQSFSRPQLDVWRAPTDNDRLGPGLAARWRAVGLHRMRHRIISETHGDDGSLTVKTRVAPSGHDFGLLATYRYTGVADGVRLDLSVEPVGEWTVPLPRLGLRFALPSSFTDVEWLGGGPGEGYADSKAACRLGRYRMTVLEMQTPYVLPQENGARTDVRWALLRSSEGEQLKLSGSRPFMLTVRPWTTEQLDAARHTTDLAPGDHVWVHVDLAQHGLGSASCGPGVLPQYELNAGPVEFSLFLQGYGMS